MAEFSEVMRQGQRMCKAFPDCDGCPLVIGKCVTTPFNWKDEDIVAFEQTIMGWAAEHPETEKGANNG